MGVMQIIGAPKNVGSHVNPASSHASTIDSSGWQMCQPRLLGEYRFHPAIPYESMFGIPKIIAAVAISQQWLKNGPTAT